MKQIIFDLEIHNEYLTRRIREMESTMLTLCNCSQVPAYEAGKVNISQSLEESPENEKVLGSMTITAEDDVKRLLNNRSFITKG